MKKIERRFWAINQYREEENWLNDMSAAGWQLVKAGIMKYEFESGPRNEYTYRLELLEKEASSEESQNYINFLEEAGIEKVGECNNWVYLRRKSSEGPFEPANKALNELTHAIRIQSSFEKIRANFIILFAVVVIASFICNFFDYSAPWFDFMKGFFEGMSFALAVVFALTSSIFKGFRRDVERIAREMALHE